MQERVLTIKPTTNSNIILVAPHGSDDIHTDTIVEAMASYLKCFAVINRGFQRSEIVDVENDKADCNKISHVEQDVVREEFLNPLQNIVKRKVERQEPVMIYYIHGAGDLVHKQAGEKVGVIIGYGKGNKIDSLTCKPWQRNAFVDCWRKLSAMGDVFDGIGGGRYAGRDFDNLNQYYRFSPNVDCMQIEIPYSLRVKHTIEYVLPEVIKNSQTPKKILEPAFKFL